MAYLVVRKAGQMPVSVPLSEGFHAGRHEQNELVLEDAHASRRHAAFVSENQRWTVRDLGSRHGTFVNGEAVSSKLLKDGDQIQIGRVILEFFNSDEPQDIVHHRRTDPDSPASDEKADQRLRLLFGLRQAIVRLDDMDAMIHGLLDGVLDALGCERALLGLGDITRGIVRRFERGRPGAPVGFILSRRVLEAAFLRREALIVQDALRESSLNTMMDQQIRSAMAVPLGLPSAAPVGLLYVDDRRAANRFTASDLEFLDALGHMLSAVLDSAERFRRAQSLAEGARAEEGEILGRSAGALELRAQIAKYGPVVHAHVLIRGESGTGKELVARALHSASPRAALPFVALNCAAIPDTMIESELFGFEKGAFTGAVKSKRGKFALADGGTLFLDEVGDLGAAAQAKLLRAIQEGEIQPLGAERARQVDVRIVSATHKDLRQEIEAGRFREDLFYRLNIVEILVPSLRERKDDIPLLAEALLRRAVPHVGKHLSGFTPIALEVLGRHHWPGNIRELRNEVERAAIHAEGAMVDACDLNPRLGVPRPVPGKAQKRSLAEQFAELEPMEKMLVEQALAEARGNISEAARLLGITRIMIKRRMERFGLTSKDD